MKLPINYSLTNHMYIHLTVYKQMINCKENYSSEDMALNNLKWLIYHKTKPYKCFLIIGVQ